MKRIFGHILREVRKSGVYKPAVLPFVRTRWHTHAHILKRTRTQTLTRARILRHFSLPPPPPAAPAVPTGPSAPSLARALAQRLELLVPMGNPVEAALMDPANFPAVPAAAVACLQHSFRDPALEQQVFTHRSHRPAPAAAPGVDGWAAAIQRNNSNSNGCNAYNYCNGYTDRGSSSSSSSTNGASPAIMDNEHLEWLGDSVLKGLTAHLLDELFPDLREGPLSVRPPTPPPEPLNQVARMRS